MLHIDVIENGAFQANCYILSNDDKDAIVIDPGAEPERIIAHIESSQFNIVGYPLTHGHMDHVAAIADVHKAHPAPVGLHEKDASWAFSEQNAMPPYYMPVRNPPPIDVNYTEGTPVTFGPFTFDILETPGHSPGGVCFLFNEDNIMISGDTLFAGSIGRTDLPGSNPSDMNHSLQKLRLLPQNYTVYPGHGPSTKLSIEKQSNPFLIHPGSAEAF